MHARSRLISLRTQYRPPLSRVPLLYSAAMLRDVGGNPVGAAVLPCLFTRG